jgi:hypothetical protein
MHIVMRISLLLFVVASIKGQIAATPTTDGKLTNVIPTAAAGLTASFPASISPTIGSLIAQRLNASSFYAGLAAELSSLPISSSASALRYVFDPSVGAYVPSAQSLGAILTERAETLGKDKLYLGITYQRFKFDTQDGVDLKNFTTRLPIDIMSNGAQLQGTASVNVGLNLAVDEVTAHLTYGITPWLDASYAFSILTSSIAFQANANLTLPTAGVNLATSSGARGTSTGLGDGVARVKAKIFDRNGLAIAFATDVRVPTGDEFNLQGAGAYGVKPFLIASYTTHALSPHLNVGYQWNGKSYLASSDNQEKQRLPAQVSLAGGADVAVSKRLTLSFDVLDQVVIHGAGLQPSAQTIDGVESQFIAFQNRTRHEVNGAGGLKTLLTKNLVLTADLLFRFNQTGLRSGTVPLVGLSYLF